MPEPLAVTVRHGALGRPAEESAVVTFHPDPSQLGLSGNDEGNLSRRLESLTIDLAKGATSFPYSPKAHILSLDCFTTPVLYTDGATPYPALIVPLSFNSLAYAGLACPEALQLFLGSHGDPLQRHLIGLLGKEEYDRLLLTVCYYTEGEYTGEEAVQALHKLYAAILDTVRKIRSALQGQEQEATSDPVIDTAVEDDDKKEPLPLPIVKQVIAELSQLKRPLFTFEQAALKIANEALFIAPFLHLIGITPGSPMILLPKSFLWLGPGDYLVLEIFDSNEAADKSVISSLTPWNPIPNTHTSQKIAEQAYNLLLETSILDTFLPKQYDFKYNGYKGAFKRNALDLDIYDFEAWHNQNKMIKDISMFDSYTMTLTHGEQKVFAAKIHIVPVGSRAYSCTMGELGFTSSQGFFGLFLRGIFQISEGRVLAPSYHHIKGLAPQDSIVLTPMGLSTPGAISCVLLEFDECV